MKKSEKYCTMYMCICVIISVFAQINTISSITRPCMYMLWIFAPIVYIYIGKGQISLSKFSIVYLFIYGVYVIFEILCSTFILERQLGSFVNLLLIPLLVTIVSEFAANYISEKSMKKIIMIYLAASLIFAIWVNLTYFPSYSSWLNQKVYAFSSKNSAAQIWASAVILSIFCVDKNNKKTRISIYAIITYLLIMCGITQCRSSVLGLIGTLMVYIIFKSKKKILLSVAIIIFLVFCLNFPITRQYIDQVMLLNKYANADMNTYSSGRLDLYENALLKFAESPIIGNGKYYVDCSYINVLAESGLIGFILIETIWFARIKGNISLIKKKKFLSDSIFCLTIYYFIESLLEANPPFGPGVCSFMFWFVCAYQNSKFLKGTTNKVIDRG